jgi:hypothetical protein
MPHRAAASCFRVLPASNSVHPCPMVERRRRERRAGLLLLAMGLAALVCCTAVSALLMIGAVAFSDADRDDASPEVVQSVARIHLLPALAN